MSEQLNHYFEAGITEVQALGVGRVTVLEALAEELPSAISADKSHRSTQMGNGVDAEDD